jgi:hypothetical protein
MCNQTLPVLDSTSPVVMCADTVGTAMVAARSKGHERLVLDNPRDTAHGSNFRNHIRGFFADRIAAGHISIFANSTN